MGKIKAIKKSEMTELSGKLGKLTFDLKKINQKRMVKYQKTENVAET